MPHNNLINITKIWQLLPQLISKLWYKVIQNCWGWGGWSVNVTHTVISEESREHMVRAHQLPQGTAPESLFLQLHDIERRRGEHGGRNIDYSTHKIALGSINQESQS